MADTEQLVVLLEARTRDFERNLARASATADRRFRAIENRSAEAAKRLETNFSKAAANASTALTRLGRAGVASLAGFAGLQNLRRYADMWTEAGNRIAAAGDEIDTVTARQSQLADIAIRSRSDFAAVTDLYAGLARSTAELGASRAQVLAVTETISKAFALSGTSASAASGAITQLNQAMSAGALRGDELNSVLEGAPALARMIAKEFGVAVGDLKTLGEQGQLTADRVFQAVLKGGAEIEAEFSRTNATIAQSFTNLDTALARYIGQADSANGASAKIAGGVNAIAENIDIVAPLVASLGVALSTLFVGGPIAAGIAGTTVAIYLFSDALRPIAGDLASIGDYARAAFEIVSSRSSEAGAQLGAAFAGAADQITAALSAVGVDIGSVFSDVLSAVKSIVNAIIGAFVFAAKTISATWNTLGFAMAEAIVGAVNAAIAAIEKLANGAVSAVNSVISGVNEAVGTSLGTIDEISLGRVENAFAGAGKRAAEAYGEAFGALTHDYVGDALTAGTDALDALRKRANEIAAERKGAERQAPALDDGDLNAPLSPRRSALPSSGSSGSSGTGRGRGGAGRSSEYDRATAVIEREIAAMAQEQEALRMSATEAEKAKVAFELLEAAKQSGIPITDELRAKVDQLAGAYATASQSLEQAKQSAQLFRDLGETFTEGLSSGLAEAIVEGKSLNETLQQLLQTLAKQALTGIFNQLFGGLFGGIFGFSEGGAVEAATGGLIRGPGTGTSDSIPARLSDGEFVVNAAATARHLDLLRAINDGSIAAYAEGGLVGTGGRGGDTIVSISAPVTVNANGGDPQQNEDLAKRTARQLEGTLRGLISDEVRRASRPGNLLNNRGR